jgi:hypothetical protein
VTEDWLRGLEHSLAADSTGERLPEVVVVLASVAGAAVEIDPDDRRGATRRALLLLAAGGDPSRGLDLNGRAVSTLADELDDPVHRAAFDRGLAALVRDAVGLKHVSEALHELEAAPDLAWRAFACALLADALAEE